MYLTFTNNFFIDGGYLHQILFLCNIEINNYLLTYFVVLCVLNTLQPLDQIHYQELGTKTTQYFLL